MTERPVRYAPTCIKLHARLLPGPFGVERRPRLQAQQRALVLFSGTVTRLETMIRLPNSDLFRRNAQ